VDIPLGSWEFDIKQEDDACPAPALTPGRETWDVLGDGWEKRLGEGTRAFGLLGFGLFWDMAILHLE
jgi:hypothetical protein